MKIGQIIKFKNSDGTLNGGTIVSFQKNSAGSDVVLLNTLDDQKITISIDKVIPIKHQITGKQSKAFIDKVKNEIELHNNGVLTNPDVKKHRDELQLWVNKYNEQSNELSKVKHEIENLVKENNDLIEKYRDKDKKCQELEEQLDKFKEENKSDIDRKQNLQYTIIGLRKAIIAGAEEKHKEQIEALLDVISDLVGVD